MNVTHENIMSSAQNVEYDMFWLVYAYQLEDISKNDKYQLSCKWKPNSV